MRVLLFCLIVPLALGCGGGKVAIDGWCDPTWTSEADGGEVKTFACTTALADTSFTLTPCPETPVLGGSCSTSTACFDCPVPGNAGTDWTCGSNGWESAGVFVCN